MEANQNITMEPYNIEYYIAKYGTVENLTNDYIGAIDGLRMQYKQYEDNPRKGGRYRREKMEHLRQQAEAIYHELLRVSLAMIDYFAATPTETPQISTETAETVNVSAEEGKREYYREYRLTNDIPLFSGDPEITEQKWLIGFIHSYGNFRVEVAYIFMRNGKLYEDIMYLTKEQFRTKYGQFLPSVNVSAGGEKEAETKEMPRYECPNYADYAFERGWSIENTDFDPHSGVLCMIHFDPSDEKYVCGCLWQINSDKPNYTEHRRFKTLKGAQNYGTKRMGMKLEYQTLTVNCSVTPSEPSQSPGTPQTVNIPPTH